MGNGGKAAIGIVIAALAAASGIYLYKNKNDLIPLIKKPEPNYLSDDEAELRPVYRILSQKEQAVYEALYSGIIRHDEKIYLPYEIDGDTYSRVYCILEKQEPDFFYLDSVFYTSDKLKFAKIAYRDDEDEANEKADELDEVKDEALENLPDGSDYDKLLYINNYIAENCIYLMDDDDEYSSTAYGCLVNGKAGCEGYSKAFQLLASASGFECELITGVTDEGENHAWNQVKVGGKWCNIDITWADHDEEDYVCMDYFLVNDDDFCKTHVADNEYFEPQKCRTNKYSYYIKNDLYADSLEKAEDIIREAFISEESYAVIRFSDADLYDDFKEKYFEDEEIVDIARDCGIKIRGGMSVTIRENRKENSLVIGID